MKENLYELLNVSPSATKAEIRSSYKKLVKKLHPDVNHDPIDAETFKKINAAATILLDDVERIKYNVSMGFKEKMPPPPPNTYSRAKQTPPSKKENAFKKALHDLFEEKPQKAQKKKGEDINMTVSITQSEAVLGTTRKVNIVHSEKCQKCSGREFINGAKCTLCNGVGESMQHKKLNVKIPAGIKDGTRIKVTGEGNAGKNGEEAGDLYLIIKIENAVNMENGINLNVPITPAEAILGAKITIPTPSGLVKLTIPKMTVSGQKFKLAQSGNLSQLTGKRADIIITIEIQIPKNITDEEIKLYEKLKNLENEEIREGLFK
jgi:DnaJ-class molecular chaperone